MALGTKVLECCGVKAELEATCPGSIVEIDCKKNKKNDRVYLCRMFVAIKACVDFLQVAGHILGLILLTSQVNIMDS
jgi:hypothetical protein